MREVASSVRSMTFVLKAVEHPNDTKTITLSWRATFVACLLSLCLSSTFAATAYSLGTGDFSLLKSYGELGAQLLHSVVQLVKPAP